MKYVLTGANGYIGSQAADKLLGEGHELALVVREGSAHPHLDQVLARHSQAAYHLHGYDGSPESLVPAFEDADRVVHLAALYKTASDPATVAELVQSNIKFAADIFSVVAQHSPKARVVTTSTFSSFAEDGTYAPATVYAATKSAVETLAPAFGIDVTFLRLSDTYGPGDWRVKVHNLIRNAAAEGRAFEMRSPSYQTINLTHVADVLGAFDRVFELPTSSHGVVRFYDLYYPENQVTLGELVQLMREVVPAAEISFPLVGTISPTPRQRLVLEGFTPAHDLKTEFAKTIFGDDK